MQESHPAVAAPPQGALLSFGRPQLLPETELPSTVAVPPQGTPFSYGSLQLLPETELLTAVAGVVD